MSSTPSSNARQPPQGALFLLQGRRPARACDFESLGAGEPTERGSPETRGAAPCYTRPVLASLPCSRIAFVAASARNAAQPLIPCLIALLAGCSSGAPAPAAPESPPASPEAASADSATAAAPAGDDERGGRLFDNWRAEKQVEADFVPDSSKTPELDGRGGPNGNGTLNSGSGQPMANTGHDYRFKNLFGWDLRGGAGIYGAQFQKKTYVLANDLSSDTRSAAMLRDWIARGDASMPAYGQVLDGKDLDDLVAYVVKTRDGALARPQNLFRLDAAAPKNYVLLPGGDAARGRERYTATCANCHGADGTKLKIDETESLGSIARTSAYEVWFKMVSGQPGTEMDRQVPATSGAEQERAILDLFAALCDRESFPVLSGGTDVADADVRCGAYLK